jgi:seryl-tRNA(Sec) selenium transferase
MICFYIDKLREFLMSKIKQTDITKLSQLEQQIEQLKEQKKKQEEQLSNKIGGYFFFNKLDLNMINSSDELYKIMDKVIGEFNKDIEQNSSDENKENLTEDKINRIVSDTMNDFKNLKKKINAEIEKAELRKHRLKNLDRKERAHRLIRKGAMLEKYFECEHLSPDETEELLKMYSNYINTNKPNKFKKK